MAGASLFYDYNATTNSSSLMVMNTNGSGAHSIQSNPGFANSVPPGVWSPDGRSIALAQASSGGLPVVNAATGATTSTIPVGYFAQDSGFIVAPMDWQAHPGAPTIRCGDRDPAPIQ
jgi:hypothetical protein